MPDAIITSTESTFGTISGTFAADQSTITGTVTGIVAGTLSGSVGVPGPAGPGVPAGGLEGQIIVKASETDYDTVWVDNAAETLTATVRNETGATLTKGTVVYINGAAGNKATVTKASASTESGSSKTFAILKDDIPNNQNGTAVTVGLLKGVDTSAFSPGANLWLSTTAGQITQTPPTSPNHAVFLGNAVRIHANQGEIEVRIQNGLELGELHDVLLTSPTNGQVLKYDATSGLWVNGTDVGGVAWGGITGDLSNQGDLVTALGLKYDASNPSGYITSSALTGYATESFVTSQGYITSAALSPYLLSSTAASTYQTIAGMSSYLTTSAAASTYYPLTNPSGYITSSALAGYATESWVTAGFYPLSSNPAGYLTSASLSGYATESWVTSQLGSYLTTSAAASTYAALAGATFTGVVGFNGASGNVAAKSTGWFKAYTSGLESTDFSLQYDTGFQVVVGGSTVARIAASGILAPSSGITFSDATTQTTAGVSAATVAATYAPLASPALTGNPTAPTPATADNDTSIATTAFVKAQGYLTSAPVTSVAGKTGAVTLVVGDVSGAAPLASPALTGTPTAPTATAGTNTTQLATTAFVQQEVPAASTTAAGKVELATLAEIITGTDTARVMPVSEIPITTASPYLRSLAAANATSVSGSGAVSASSGHQFSREAYLASGSSGRASFQLGFPGTANAQPSFHTSNFGQINFSNKIVLSGTTVFGISGYGGNTNTRIYVTLGGYSGATTGDMTQKGIGIKKVGGTSSVIELIVHNGTSQTSVSTSVTSALAEAVNWTIYSDGTGNVTLYINGTQAATTSAGPTGTNTAGNSSYREQVECPSGSGTNHSIHSVGGWVYIRP